jgi:DNA-binding transcriptional LysR family regulator
MLDDVEGLRAVVSVADLGSFAAAGRAMRLSTNAVSHRVARLEERLGARLFERTTRLVRTTDAGDRLLLRARRVLEELELAEREVSAGNLAGTVRVALPPDLAGPTLMAALARVLAAAPALKLELLGRALPSDPRKEGLDLVVWGGPRERIPPDLTARDVGSLAWSLCASPAYVAHHGAPKTPNELSGHRCLLARHPEPERTWQLVSSTGKEVSVSVSGNLESDHPRMLLEAMLQGLGIGIRPALEVQAASSRGEWVHVLPEWGFRPIPVALVAPRGRLRVPSVRLVADTLESTLKLLGGAPSHDV